MHSSAEPWRSRRDKYNSVRSAAEIFRDSMSEASAVTGRKATSSSAGFDTKCGRAMRIGASGVARPGGGVFAIGLNRNAGSTS